MVDQGNTEEKGREDASKTPPQNAGADGTPEPVILEEHVVAPAKPAAVPTPPPQPVAPVETAPSVAPAPPPTISVVPPPPVPETPAPKTGIVSNIASMLEAIKLPERRVAKTEAPKRTYDTALSIDPKNAAENTRAEAAQKAKETARAITESLPNTTPSPVDDVRALHTLKDDLQHVVRDQKISLVRAVALEEEKRHHSSAIDEHVATQTTARKRTHYGLFIAGTLFLLGCVAIGAVLYVMAERTQKAAAPVTAAVLFAEQAAPLVVDNLSAVDIRREIGNARASALTLGAILEILPVTEAVVDGTSQATPITFSQFLERIGARAPEELSRALSGTFFLGLHTVDENAPLIVVPVVSYERAFAAMLEWEKTLNADLAPMFTLIPPRGVGQNGLPEERRFEDVVMRNYDVRALKDDSGTIQLYYSFPTRNVLIIAESPYSFSEILSRLRADRKL